ncbi:hypothetical protein ACMTN4_07365 [Rhodococcus globerulus]|uniref:hypothetical protein n=1 Tax=Rhodococcus globerulus TaxID=33008 RepID=UPI0039EB3948
MNITHNVVVEGVQLTIEANHSVIPGGTEDMTVEVFQDGERASLKRIITKPTDHFVTDDGMVDTEAACNCGPDAACSSCPRTEVRVATKREAALAAVYEAIEQQVGQVGSPYSDKGSTLTALAALVDALVSASVTEAQA